ncbi:MaoC family dehydratase [Nonomuraea sp. MG754425]|uniref:FAS1-like dehydratase domain-containing protein n=1 Tax=Nonomuraea sp. MG754425 TaxID=2570319 RepID=UPI001F209E5B|nr:MaoC family dehydratase N-terminal domain-containing protein [Nonomuraea sp. MG754425]MCF6474434.1 MaoC family dehydratase [Nonomuraea sp. MG754425]
MIELLREAVGWAGPEREDVVERRHLDFYRHAVGDTSSEIPPTFTACFLDEPPSLPAAGSYGSGWLNGGDRFEYHAPLRVGDVLVSRPRFTGVVEKSGRAGPMALLTFETEFRRPDGELVVRHIGTRIRK